MPIFKYKISSKIDKNWNCTGILEKLTIEIPIEINNKLDELKLKYNTEVPKDIVIVGYKE
jgi:hypothetical protein